MLDALISSASIPWIFPPTKMDNEVLVDGGVYTNIDLSDAIVKCKDMGYEEKDIIIDAIFCFDKQVFLEEWSMFDSKYKNAYQLYERKENFVNFYYYYEDITRVVRGYPDVHFRHLIAPTMQLPGTWLPILEGREEVETMIKAGYEDTEKNLKYYFSKYPHHSIDYNNSTSPKV